MSKKRKPKIIVFLGAGASRNIGYHTFASFTSLLFNNEIREKEKLGRLHDKSNIILLLKEIENSLKILAKPATHDNFLWSLNDYKQLWHNVRIDNVLRSRFLKNAMLWGEYSHFSRLTEDAINEITDTTITHYAANKVETIGRDTGQYGNLRNIYNLYEKLALENDELGPFLPVFSTNYDMFLEDLQTEFGASGGLELVNGIENYITESSPWDQDEYEKTPCGLHYYRLHGCSCLYYHGPHDTNVYFHRNGLPENPQANLYAIYPGRERLLGLNPHSLGFRKLYEYAAECDCIVFIGFSFRDDDVKLVVLSANSTRKEKLKVVVIDPNLRQEDIRRNLIETGKRTQFPVCIPDLKDIHCIDCYYGEGDFYNRIIKGLFDTGVMK
ncbi:MAG: SIR2 family protein [Spirochaetales bacterium]|nr:SIR2 family protein [Spirochaetales bacterium]